MDDSETYSEVTDEQAVSMFGKRKVYLVPLHELTAEQTLHEILQVSERMEVLLQSIDSKMGLYPEHVEKVAEAIANGIDKNTERLSKIDTLPDAEPRV